MAIPEEFIRVTKRDQARARVLVDIAEDRLSAAEGAEALGLSSRQLRRLQVRFRSGGIAGLAHGNAGRIPTNVCGGELRQRVLELWKEKYSSYTQAYFTELLERDEGILLCRMTVRRILATAGIGAVTPQRRTRHRRHRLRRAQAGAMIQADGSDHDWLEGRGPRLTLVGGIDDATSRAWGVFRLSEDTQGYMELLQEIVLDRGIPTSWYTDRTAIALGYQRTPERVATGTTAYSTHFGRVLEQLDISLVQARSPQAKGRIERLWRTLQDRLVCELRSRGVATLAGAQRVLREHLAFHNRNFEKAALNLEPAWRPLPADIPLRDLITWSYRRMVTNANTLSVDGLRLQLEFPSADPGWARRRVQVYRRLDGTWFASSQGLAVPATPINASATAAAA